MTNRFDFTTSQFIAPQFLTGNESLVKSAQELGQQAKEKIGKPIAEFVKGSVNPIVKATTETLNLIPARVEEIIGNKAEPGSFRKEVLAPLAGFAAGFITPESELLKTSEIADSALSKLINAIKEAGPAREELAVLQSAERAKRVGAATGALEKGTGEQAFFAAKGQLKGELVPNKPSFEGLKIENQPNNEPINTNQYTPASNKIVESFNKSIDQEKIGPFEIGTFGKNAGERKITQVDRFPQSELPETIVNIKNFYRASSDPTNYRYDNIAHISEMPNGEKRVIYTRQNSKGAEEIINWHKINEKTNPNFIKTLESNGIPTGNRTQIFSLERSNSNPLSYGDNINVANNINVVNKNLTQSDIEILASQIQKHPYLTTFEKINAFDGLHDILNGVIPQSKKLSLLEDVFGSNLVKTTLEHRTRLEKLKDAGLQLANLPRSIMSSVDLSFGGRQGIFVAPKYRKEFFNSWTKQFGAFGSEKAAQKIAKEIADNPDYLLAKESGISFTKTGALMDAREEKYASNWGDKIPLIKQSSRAYTAFANKFRMDIFSSMIKDAKAVGLNPYADKELAQEMARFVNTATGRGDLPKSISKISNVLNAVFFSPRLMASRLTLLNPLYYVKADPFVRQQALKSLIGFGSFVATTLTLAKLAGADVGTDIRSSDFSKIKIGNTRFDIAGGFQQYIRMAAQLVTGQYVSSTTGKIITLGEGYKPMTRFDILQKQIESKEAPIFSFITDLLKGHDFTGKPINVSSEIVNRMTPMVIQDLYDLAKDDPDLLPFGLLGIFGIGVQTYKGKKTSNNFNF